MSADAVVDNATFKNTADERLAPVTAENTEKTKKSIAKKRAGPRMLSVKKTMAIGTGLTRITFTGKELTGFPECSHGMHIKLFFPRDDQTVPVLPTVGDKGIVWPPAALKPITRTYSVRAYRPDVNELDVDFVKHCDSSPASGWAAAASVGSQLGLAGPGGPAPLLAAAPWSIIAGDLSALPAIAALLENMAPNVLGHVYIELDDMQHSIPLVRPQGVQVHWIHRKPHEASLLNALKRCVFPSQIAVSGFIAGESSAVVAIRDFLTANYGLSKCNLYAVPYWRRGEDEETYHADRHRIMDEEY